MTLAKQAAQGSTDAGATVYKYDPPSLYVTDAFYDWLVDVSLDLDASKFRGEVVSADIQGEIEQLLAAEARLLDQKAFSTWLDLYHDECAYWIPSEWPAPDPRKTVTLEFHDLRRLLDRAARLETGLAYSQYPASRTSRVLSGVEIWASEGRSDEWRVRCNFALSEFRNGFNRVLAGWNGFVIRRTDDGLRVVLKQINLIDCDRPQGNNSFFL
ncbi:aromatic-ring-hydroxylating dioxygenase subunit beta [Sphingobium chungbukense]|uniref:aromatic-ring-hydroxylating dioxygenase subunit beta n=1 Tax=Sphingobium chungbukense TaxID=56193 RepID=UPI000699C8BD|nr:aromatic-ring-hydroxylating dioxygenase subunit beta [Sphingobium chungbukense]